MRGGARTQLVRGTWPQDEGRSPSPVVSRRGVALSPSVLQAGGKGEHRGYPKAGYAGSRGLLRGAQAASALCPPSPRRDPSPLPRRYARAPARRCLDAGGFRRRGGSRARVPPALPRSPSHAGAPRGGSAQHRSPRRSPARRGQSSPGSAVPGDRFSLKARQRCASRPQRVNKQFPLLTARRPFTIDCGRIRGEKQRDKKAAELAPPA